MYTKWNQPAGRKSDSPSANVSAYADGASRSSSAAQTAASAGSLCAAAARLALQGIACAVLQPRASRAERLRRTELKTYGCGTNTERMCMLHVGGPA